MDTRKPPKLTGARCQCCACGECFNRDRAFDRHRIGQIGVDRRCLTATEMTARGWHRNAAGFWIMDAMDSAARAQLRPALARPAPLPLPDPDAPDSRAVAGAL